MNNYKIGNNLPTVNIQQGQQDTYETQYIIRIVQHLFVAGHTSRANVNKRTKKRVLCIVMFAPSHIYFLVLCYC